MPEPRSKKKLPLIGEALPAPSSGEVARTSVRARAVAHMRSILAATAVVAACDKPSATREPVVDAAPDASGPVDAAPDTTIATVIADASADDASADAEAGTDAGDASTTAKRAGPCDPPTMIDARGNRVCKPVCYHTERRYRGPVSDPPGPMPGWKPPPPDPCLRIEYIKDGDKDDRDFK